MQNMFKVKNNEPEQRKWQAQKNFSSKIMQKRDRETSYRPHFVFKKVFYEEKASGLKIIFNIFQYTVTWHTIIKTV